MIVPEIDDNMMLIREESGKARERLGRVRVNP